MSPFPSLVVLSTNGVPRLERGARLPLLPRFQIGNEVGCDLVVAAPSVGRRHCVIELVHGRWWVRHLGHSSGTAHNGKAIHDSELQHGDVVELPYGIAFRFETRADVRVRNPDFEKAIAERPEDDALRLIYADWLTEHQDDTGERMLLTGKALQQRSGAWLGPLATVRTQGALEATWRHGFLDRVVLRNPAHLPSAYAPKFLLECLTQLDAARFLRRLEIDVASFHALPPARVKTIEAIEQVLAPRPFPMLEQVTIGPIDDGVRAPNVTSVNVTLTSLTAPWVQVEAAPVGIVTAPKVGARKPLVPGREFLISDLESLDAQFDLLRISTAAGREAANIGLSITQDLEGRWWIRDLSVPTRTWVKSRHVMAVNGRDAPEAMLRPGDLIEAAPGLLFRFCG